MNKKYFCLIPTSDSVSGNVIFFDFTGSVTSAVVSVVVLKEEIS